MLLLINDRSRGGSDRHNRQVNYVSLPSYGLELGYRKLYVRFLMFC